MWSQVAQQHYRQEDFPSLHVTDCQILALPHARHWLFERFESFVFVVFPACRLCSIRMCWLKIVNNTNPVIQRRSTSTGGLLPSLIQMSPLHHCSATHNVRHVCVACLSSMWTCWFHSNAEKIAFSDQSSGCYSQRERTLISVGLTPVHARPLSWYCQIKTIILFLSIM